ncbi:hypothetical protein G5V59_19475 [Nocardioides sp. W3-2-3]|uniref:hypothetical protein n=1 Tax=Nocardioides convexus TaxID=2712224 RepID=UPI0024185427|nr:hypothetical protein [Nocardioides convexus]NHA01296.1 hypothetical protein [Nocardioides convexus]
MNQAAPKSSDTEHPRMTLLLCVSMTALVTLSIVVLVVVGLLSLVKVLIALVFVAVMGGFMYVLTWPESH